MVGARLPRALSTLGLALGSTLVLSLSLLIADARASCAAITFTVIPEANGAPLNTHVWVIGREHDTRHCPWNGPNGQYGPCEDTMRFELRTPAEGERDERIVPTTVRRRQTDAPELHRAEIVELVPKADLEPKRLHEIWRVETHGRTPDTLVSLFKTGSERDPSAPKWAGGDRIQKPRPSPPRPGVVYISDMIGTFGWALLGRAPEDAEGPVLFQVWLPEPDGSFDYSRPSDGVTLAYAYSPAGSSQLAWLGGSDCEPNNFRFPADRSIPKLAVRATDLAGNMSPPSIVPVH